MAGWKKLTKCATCGGYVSTTEKTEPLRPKQVVHDVRSSADDVMQILKIADKGLDAGSERSQLRPRATESRIKLVMALERVVTMLASKLRAAEDRAWSSQGSKAGRGITQYRQLAKLSRQFAAFVNKADKIQPTRSHASIFEVTGQSKAAKVKGHSIESLSGAEPPLIRQKDIAAIIHFSEAQVSRFRQDADFPKRIGTKYNLLEVMKWAADRGMKIDLAKVKGLEAKYLVYEEKIQELGRT